MSKRRKHRHKNKNHVENFSNEKPLPRDIIKHREKFIKTNEDWHPPFDDGTIRVRLYHYRYENSNDKFRICVWGNDDTGMEYDECTNVEEATEMYDQIIDYTPMEKLIELFKFSWV